MDPRKAPPRGPPTVSSSSSTATAIAGVPPTHGQEYMVPDAPPRWQAPLTQNAGLGAPSVVGSSHGPPAAMWAPPVPLAPLPVADIDIDMTLLMSELLAGTQGGVDDATTTAAAALPYAKPAHQYAHQYTLHAPPRVAPMIFAPHMDAGAAPRGRYGSAPMTSPLVAVPPAPHAVSPALAEPPPDVQRLIRWIETVIRQHGGRVIGANLGSALANSNSSLYRSIKTRFGGLTPLLGKVPDSFLLENDPPFNHVSLRPRVFTADPLSGVMGGAMMPAIAPLLLAPLQLPRGAPIPVVERRAPGDVEAALVKATSGILREVASGSLKAVELANMLRARMGTETLAAVREHHGGLLALLERHPATFRVSRIPKNDCVALVSGGAWAGGGGCAGAAVYGHDVAVMTSAGGSLGSLDPTSHMVASAVASKCLHVGNVAASLTDSELRAQFGAFGRIEALKLVSQKGRRFAFVNFVTVEEAERAKAGLCKMHMWRSNISFARRETIAIGAQGGVASGMSGGGGGGGGGIGVDSCDDDDAGIGGPSTDAASIDAKRNRWLRTRNLTPSRHLWIGCLYNSSKVEVLERFRAFGPIDDVNYLKDRHCAFVDFATIDDCVVAFRAMQGARVGDQVVELGFGRNRSDTSGGMAPPVSASAVAKPMLRGRGAPEMPRPFDEEEASFIHGHGGMFAPPPHMHMVGAHMPSAAHMPRGWGAVATAAGGARAYAGGTAYDTYGHPSPLGMGPPPTGAGGGAGRTPWQLDAAPSPLMASSGSSTWPPPLRSTASAWGVAGPPRGGGGGHPWQAESGGPIMMMGEHDGHGGPHTATATTAEGRATLSAMRAAAAAAASEAGASEWGPTHGGGGGGGGASSTWGGYGSARSEFEGGPSTWGAPALAGSGGGGGGAQWGALTLSAAAPPPRASAGAYWGGGYDDAGMGAGVPHSAWSAEHSQQQHHHQMQMLQQQSAQYGGPARGGGGGLQYSASMLPRAEGPQYAADPQAAAERYSY